MARENLRERINRGTLLLDGAMGTQLIARGIEPGRCNESLNIESSQIVEAVHRAYFEAGSDAVLTNTFGGNGIALKRHGLAKQAGKINRAAAEIARTAAGENKYVLGDIGPSGDFLEPLGTLKKQDLENAFKEQAQGLLRGGVDGFIIETMSALEEIVTAIEAIQSLDADLPVFASMAFENKGGEFRTMMGVDAAGAIARIVPLGVDAVGFNCGDLSLDDYIRLADVYRSHIKQGVRILAEPNAGRPELVEARPVYKVTPEEFASALQKINSKGANIIGGCCGTGPEHIKELAGVIK